MAINSDATSKSISVLPISPELYVLHDEPDMSQLLSEMIQEVTELDEARELDPGGGEESDEALVVDDDDIAPEDEEDDEIDVDVEEDDEEIDEEETEHVDMTTHADSPAEPLPSPPTLAALLANSESPRSSSETSTASVRHVPEKRHICDVCGKAFSYFSVLESHKRCHTGEKPYLCPHENCGKRFAQKATLQVHERTHTGERPYKCRYCEKTFAQYGTKTVHEKSAHLGIRNYKCPKCDKCLSSPSALYTHKKTHGEKTFKCNYCAKTFTLNNYLKLHVKQVHELTERKFACTVCDKKFAYQGSLQVHIRTHTGERPYACRYCSKRFASQGNLQSHERTHTGERPYSCSTCGRSFIQKSQLTAHEGTHTTSAGQGEGQQKGTDYECKFCNKHFQHQSSLYVHVRQHTGERPFRCQYCDKTFTNQGNMQVHERTHTGVKPYICRGCNKSYTQKVGLNIHIEHCSSFRELSVSENSVDSASDCSDEFKRVSSEFVVPNIYRSNSDVSPSCAGLVPAQPTFSTYQQLSLAEMALKMPNNQLNPLTGLTMPSLANTSPISAFTSPERPPTDFGPLVASQPPALSTDLNQMPESLLSAFTTPVKPVDTQMLLQSLVLENLAAQPTLLNQLSTQLLLQQLTQQSQPELFSQLQPQPLLNGILPFLGVKAE